MNRHTTKILKTLLTIGTVLVFVSFFGVVFSPTILKSLGIKILGNGLEFLILIPLVFVGVLAILVLSLVVKYRQDSHRREDLQKLARQNNWSFTRQMELPFLKELNAFLNDSWTAGANALTGSSNNILMGKMNGRNIMVSDQIYSVGTGKNRTTYEKTLIGIELLEAQLPVMSLYPEGFMDKVFDALSRFDIDFAHRPLFSQRFVLYGRNENQIRSFFNDRIVDFYEQNPNFTTVCGGRYLVIYEDRLLKPPEIMARLNLIFGLANLFLKKS